MHYENVSVGSVGFLVHLQGPAFRALPPRTHRQTASYNEKAWKKKLSSCNILQYPSFLFQMKNVWSYTPTPSYLFMDWCSKHKNLIFLLLHYLWLFSLHMK
jgi:hypothetical protein